MELIAIALALGVTLAVFSGGTLTRILDTRVRWPGLVFASLATQLLLAFWHPPGGWSSGMGLAVYVGSFVLLGAFCALNLRLTGMSVVLVGVSLNALVVMVNGGMPVRLPTDATEAQVRAVEESVTHESDDGATLGFLGQIIVLGDPLHRSFSFGDLILAVGVVDVVFRAGQDPQRRRRSAGAPRPPSASDTHTSSAARTPGS